MLPDLAVRIDNNIKQRDLLATSKGAGEDEMSKATFDPQTILALLTSRNSRGFYLLFLLFGCCALLYYFGELVSSAGWEALRWHFFYGVHDIQRLLFLAPIIYAGYVFGVKAAVIITIVAIMTFLPRALFISPFPDPLLRTVLFIIIAGTMGYLTARVRSESERRSRLEALLISERDGLLGILERMEEGVFITGPDYRIRFMNPSMVRDFGEGVGSYCYEYLHKFHYPCQQICKLFNVMNGAVERWEYNFPDGRTYEVLASPYSDSDGTVCQLATFRNITQRQKLD
jgi:PAS domain-containing protein